jgi:hypothetical protein
MKMFDAVYMSPKLELLKWKYVLSNLEIVTLKKTWGNIAFNGRQLVGMSGNTRLDHTLHDQLSLK